MYMVSWCPDMRLGNPRIDAAHESFLRELGELGRTDDANFCEAFQKLVMRMEEDFREEDFKMDEIDYPGLALHREQHARILGALHQVAGHVMRGDIAIGRQAAELLPHWFMLHLSTMDTALALTLEMSDDAHPDTRRAPRVV